MFSSLCESWNIVRDGQRTECKLEHYFSVLPAYRGIYRDIGYQYDQTVSETVTNPYNSSREEKMSRENLKSYLLEKDLLLSSEEEVPLQRYWPGDKEDSATGASTSQADTANV